MKHLSVLHPRLTLLLHQVLENSSSDLCLFAVFETSNQSSEVLAPRPMGVFSIKHPVHLHLLSPTSHSSQLKILPHRVIMATSKETRFWQSIPLPSSMGSRGSYFKRYLRQQGLSTFPYTQLPRKSMIQNDTSETRSWESFDQALSTITDAKENHECDDFLATVSQQNVASKISHRENAMLIPQLQLYASLEHSNSFYIGVAEKKSKIMDGTSGTWLGGQHLPHQSSQKCQHFNTDSSPSSSYSVFDEFDIEAVSKPLFHYWDSSTLEFGSWPQPDGNNQEELADLDQSSDEKLDCLQFTMQQHRIDALPVVGKAFSLPARKPILIDFLPQE